MAAPTASDGDITHTRVGSSQGGGCEFILYRHLPQLVKYLNIDSMRIYLRAEEFLSEDDMEKLTPNPPHYVGSQIVETLVKLVKQNGTEGFKKFLSALKKSVEAGYHSGHKELLELLEKDRSSTEKSAEMNLSLKEAGSNCPELNNPVRLIECSNENEEHHDDEANEDYSLVEANQRSRKRGKCRWCSDAYNWCRDNDSKVFKCSMIVGAIFFLGIGVPQLTISGMGAAASTARDTASEFNLILFGTSPTTSGFHCQLSTVVPFHISTGIFLTCVGLLLCTIMVWRAVGKSLAKVHKCLHYTFLFVLAVLFCVLIAGLFASLLAVFVLFIGAAVEVFPIAKAVYCNHVLYYWAFVYVVILLAVIGVAIIVAIICALVFLFSCLLAWTD